MFAEVKSNLYVSGDDYDRQIVQEINMAVLDLTRTAEIVLPGAVSVSIDQNGAVTDESTLTDEYIIGAIITWCQMRIGNPPNHAQLLATYNTLKGNMRQSRYYTRFADAE